MDMDEALRILGKRIAMERNVRGWTQKELAETSGVNVRMIKRVEAGERAGGADVPWRLARALGFEFSEAIAEAERRAN